MEPTPVVLEEDAPVVAESDVPVVAESDVPVVAEEDAPVVAESDLSGSIPFPTTSLPETIETLSLDDLMSERDVVITKEQVDKSALESIACHNLASVKPKLVEWAMKGFPNAYPIFTVDIQPPTKCSDGEIRSLSDYIQFCSGKTIQEHVVLLQEKLVGMKVEFANVNGQIAIVVSKA